MCICQVGCVRLAGQIISATDCGRLAVVVACNSRDNAIVCTTHDVPCNPNKRRVGVISEWQIRACYRLFEALILRAMTSV